MHPLIAILVIILILITYGTTLDSFILSNYKPETFLSIFLATTFVLVLLTWKLFFIYVAYCTVLILVGTKLWGNNWRKRGKFYLIFILLGAIFYLYKNVTLF